ncbi:MAG: hypothetical protein DRP12_00325 [Candidatus Aenigmatarchaeota archaeon]|nr:MAG: hypothetical protein DRP12_00325 [Candidatus Aenigmarchaeota archaeon]
MLVAVLKSLLSRAVTSKYPFRPEKPPEKLRGEIKWDEKKCIKCLKCVRTCPTGACHLAGNRIEIDKNKCLFCYLCVDACPVSALVPSQRFELAYARKKPS